MLAGGETVAVAKGHRYDLGTGNYVIIGEDVAAVVQDDSSAYATARTNPVELAYAQALCNDLDHRWGQVPNYFYGG